LKIKPSEVENSLKRLWEMPAFGLVILMTGLPVAEDPIPG
jgi:hypothetical protein